VFSIFETLKKENNGYLTANWYNPKIPKPVGAILFSKLKKQQVLKQVNISVHKR